VAFTIEGGGRILPPKEGRASVAKTERGAMVRVLFNDSANLKAFLKLSIGTLSVSPRQVVFMTPEDWKTCSGRIGEGTAILVRDDKHLDDMLGVDRAAIAAEAAERAVPEASAKE